MMQEGWIAPRNVALADLRLGNLIDACDTVHHTACGVTPAQADRIDMALNAFTPNERWGPAGALLCACDVLVSFPDRRRAVVLMCAARELVCELLEEAEA